METCESGLDIACQLSNLARWVLDLVLWVPRKIFSLLLDGLATVLEALPVPTFVADLHGALGQFSGGALYLANFFQLGQGLAIIMGAYAIRFAIRRIPFIG